jgi:hypothetical protein
LYGLRRIYREGAKWWHKQSKNNPSNLYINPNQDPLNYTRPCPCPKGNLPYKPGDLHYDLVIVSDFNVKGILDNIKILILSAVNQDKKIAIFHWRRYELEDGKPLSSEAFNMSTQYNIDILVPGDNISADTIVVMDPKILIYKVDDAPTIRATNIVINTNGQDESMKNELNRAKQNALDMFGSEGKWVDKFELQL